MKDSLRFRGEVIARNKATGEILFKQHNCIVEGGRIMTLAKAYNMTRSDLVALASAMDNTDLANIIIDCGTDSGNYGIKYFKAGYDTSAEAMAHPLAVNTQAIDIHTDNPWYVNKVGYFSKEDAAYTRKDDIPEEYYQGASSYNWPDVQDTDMQPLINKASDFDTLFIRYKLIMKMPSGAVTVIDPATESVIDPAYIVPDDLDQDDPYNLGWHKADLTVPYVTINELGLFMTSDVDVAANKDWIMFSLLKFPPVTLQAEMEVEFEYRIYG